MESWTDGFPEDSTTLTVKKHTPHTPDENGRCTVCGLQLAASVTTAEGQTTHYETLDEALAAAYAASGSTLRLYQVGENVNLTVSTNLTIDWNGRSVTQLTITGGTVTLQDTSTKGTGGVGGTTENALDIQGGTVTILGGSYNNVNVAEGAQLTATGGSFRGTEYQSPITFQRDADGTPNFELPKGYALYDANKHAIRRSEWEQRGFNTGITVTAGLCTYHELGNNGACRFCDEEPVAYIDEYDENGVYAHTTYYTDAAAALKALDGTTKGNKFALMADTSLKESVTISGSFTIDCWNSTLSGGSITFGEGSQVTMAAGKGYTGTINLAGTTEGASGKLTIESGSYGNINLTGGSWTLDIQGGSFESLPTSDKVPLELEKGYVLCDAQGNAWGAAGGYQEGTALTLQRHQHHQPDENGKCICGISGAAVVETVDWLGNPNGETGYDTLEDAIKAIHNASGGSTLTLWQNATLKENVTINTSTTIDWNGHTVSGNGSFYADQYVTLTDSVGGGGLQMPLVLRAQGAEINGGTYQSVELAQDARLVLSGGTYGSLSGCSRYNLAEGYALYDRDDENTVVNINQKKIENVTIQAHEHDSSKGICPCGGITSGACLDLPSSELYGKLGNRSYQVNGESLSFEGNSRGSEGYFSREDGKSLKNAIFQTFDYSDELNSNGETYPIGMKVYRAVETEDHTLELKEETALENLLLYDGASVRCTGENGIRIITGMTKENKAALTGAGLDGFKLVNYGTVAAWVKEMGNDPDLTLEKTFARSGCAYRRGIKDIVFKDLEDRIQYTNVLVNFPDDWCGEPIALRSFATLEVDGVEVTIYGGQVQRSISGIAQQILKDSGIDLTAEEKAYVEQLVKNGETGKQ